MENILISIKAEDYASDVLATFNKEVKASKDTTAKLITKLQEELAVRQRGIGVIKAEQAARAGATAEQQQQIVSLYQSIEATKRGQQANSALIQQSRQMRGMFGQLGHQVQDVAVQLSMGTNAMMVFAQQGGQVASIMGPWGAIAGAVLSVGAAIGVYIQASDKANATGEKAAQVLDKYFDSAVAAAEKTDEMTAAKSRMLQLDTIIQLREEEKALKAIQNAHDEAVKTITKANKDREQVEKQAAAGAGLLSTIYLTLLNSVLKPTEDEFFTMGTAIAKTGDASTESKDKIAALEKTLEQLRNGTFLAKTELNSFDQALKDAKALNAFVDKIEEAGRTTAFNARQMDLYKAALRGANQEEFALINAAHDRIDAHKQATEAAKEKAEEEKRSNNEALAAEKSRLTSIQNLIAKHDQQARATSDTKREMALYTAAQLKATDADIAKINASFDIIEAYEREQEAIKATQKALEEKRREEKRAADETKRHMERMADGMADAIINAENLKDAFRGMAQSIIQDMLRMYLRAQIMNIFGAILGNFATGSQLAPQGQMQFAGTSSGNFAIGAPSYDGGGFTGYGSRSGGIDGRGGFGAILHPNETVIDHTKGQSMGDTINISLNVSTGVSQTVRAEMMNLMPAITNATKAAVADARRRGGSFSKQMVGN